MRFALTQIAHQYQQQQNNTVPSRSFKLLQAMTKPENAGKFDHFPYAYA